MDEPVAGFRAGQRLQQRHTSLHRDVLHHHQIHGERLQVRAVPDPALPGTVGAGRGVDASASARHLVHVVLGDGDGYLGDVGLLVAVDDPQIGRGLQIRAAAARAFGKPVLVYVGFPPELEMRPRRTGLLAAFTAFTSTFRLHRRWCLAGGVVTGRWHRGVAAVARLQMLEFGQLRRQRRVGRRQFLDPCGLLAQQRGHRDHRVANHQRRREHPMIKPRHRGRR